MRKILIASDHAGFALKKFLLTEAENHLKAFNFIDLGPSDETSVDYPDYAVKLCDALLAKKADTGILICGSGQGMCMQANRYTQIRAALGYNENAAKLSREHNDANVLCLAGRSTAPSLALNIVKIFLDTPFSHGARHVARVEKLGKF